MTQENTTSSAQVCLPLVLSSKSDETCLYDYWKTLVKRKKMIVLITLLVTLIAGGYILWMKPKYVAETSLIYAKGSITVDSTSSDHDDGGRSSTTSATSSGIGTEEEAIAILTSRVFIKQFITREKIMPDLYPDEWALSKDGNEVVSTVKKPTSLLKAYKVFNKEILTVSKDKTTGVTLLEIQWKNAEQASNWANLLIKQLNDHLKKRDLANANKGLAYINKEIVKTNVSELQLSLYGMIETYMQAIMLADITDEYAFTVIDPSVTPEIQVWTPLKRILLIVFIAITTLMLTALYAFFLDWLDENKNGL